MKSFPNLYRVRNLERVRSRGSFKSDSLILCTCPPFLTQQTLVAMQLRESALVRDVLRRGCSAETVLSEGLLDS
jgi:hypothetical protein